ncbi:hypothetical protein CVT26_012419 [Gymnopilus dilepis]|uniref:F-box domain-containing protein n=1 Tax=Gymnopilus dilepis TaxID=231916 RepID=A0A409YWD4_9AGAR|nr:hypothetical protein CVT26_012419 [Gymnopilus dilepis]
MPTNVFELDSDTSSLIYNLLDSSTLRALSNSSRDGFVCVTPWLVRKVNISLEQVPAFCHFALKYDLCADIMNLRLNVGISRGATYDPILAKVLERAINMTHFAHLAVNTRRASRRDDVENPFPFESLPPSLLSLKLVGSLGTGLERLQTMTKLAHLVLLPPPPAEYNTPRERAVEAVIRKSACTLESLTLGHALPPSLRTTDVPTFACKKLHHLCISGTSVSQEQLALMFPNLKSLEIMDDSMIEVLVDQTPESSFVLYGADEHRECPPRMLFPNLQSFCGPHDLALNLSRYHPLCRIVLNEGTFRATELSFLSDILLNLTIRSLTLDVRVPGSIVVSGTTFDHILPLARHLAFLSLHIGVFEYETCCRLVDCLLQAATFLSPYLQDLRYFRLRLETYNSTSDICHHNEAPIKLDAIVGAWAAAIPSLRYIELDVDHRKLGHSFWRVSPQHGMFLQVSKEEGLSARNWYDTAEWKENHNLSGS